MPTVELERVCKSYDHVVAVDELSFTIPSGSIFGLLGPNGAGKTSTIRMTIGITMPDSGQVRLFGEPFSRKHLQRVGYLPEERGLYKKMKVLEHLVLLGRLHGLGAAESSKRACDWCERLEISEKLQKKVEELSKGMQQKIQFIAALMHNPDFIIMDEPFSGLDPVNTVLLKNVLLEMKKAGKTILFSTHQMEQVERLCDAITLMSGGKAVLQGDLRQIKARYGRNNVQIEYDGNGDFLQHSTLVQSYNNFGNYVEVRLAPGADAQELLRSVAAHSRVSKFELVEPSLEEIFIDVVGKNNHA
jgi:ABC-2 type transport system ATP-binding protein